MKKHWNPWAKLALVVALFGLTFAFAGATTAGYPPCLDVCSETPSGSVCSNTKCDCVASGGVSVCSACLDNNCLCGFGW